MKLKKKKLISLTESKLASLKYVYLKDTLIGSEGLFVKPISDMFFLTLGLTISNFYDSKFTGTFYLSKTLRWASVWGDIPKNSYKRIGHFLKPEERNILLDAEHSASGVVDAWWDITSEKGVDSFIQAVKIAEERFLAQPKLFEMIEASVDVKELFDNAKNVIDTVKSNGIRDIGFKFTPKNPIDDIPLNWFRAAEMVLTKARGIINQNTVKLLAADAWRIFSFQLPES